MGWASPELSQKRSGAYFTPEDVSAALVAWACRKPSDRMLDPSCGDGQFLALHRNSVGIEQNPVSAHQAIERAPGALVHEGDFFTWATETGERFECAAGNPPFHSLPDVQGRGAAPRDRFMSRSRCAVQWPRFVLGAVHRRNRRPAEARRSDGVRSACRNRSRALRSPTFGLSGRVLRARAG